MNLSQEVKQLFDEAALSRQFKYLNAAEREQFTSITKRYEALRAYEQRVFELEYKTRLEVATKRVINRAGKKPLDHKPRWFSQDRFEKSAIERQAHREIIGKHQALLSHIKRMELKELNVLVDRAAFRQSQREKPKQDFQRASDRRSGLDRRKSKPVRRTRN